MRNKGPAWPWLVTSLHKGKKERPLLGPRDPENHIFKCLDNRKEVLLPAWSFTSAGKYMEYLIEWYVSLTCQKGLNNN